MENSHKRISNSNFDEKTVINLTLLCELLYRTNMDVYQTI